MFLTTTVFQVMMVFPNLYSIGAAPITCIGSPLAVEILLWYGLRRGFWPIFKNSSHFRQVISAPLSRSPRTLCPLTSASTLGLLSILIGDLQKASVARVLMNLRHSGTFDCGGLGGIVSFCWSTGGALTSWTRGESSSVAEGCNLVPSHPFNSFPAS